MTQFHLKQYQPKLKELTMKTQPITGGLFYDVWTVHHHPESIVPMSHQNTSLRPFVPGRRCSQMHLFDLPTVITVTSPMSPMASLVASSNISLYYVVYVYRLITWK